MAENATLVCEDDPSIWYCQITYWVYCFTMPVLLIFGLVGNSLALIVLSRTKNKTPTIIYLTVLAISDILTATPGALERFIRGLTNNRVYLRFYFNCSGFTAPYYIASYVSAWMIVSVAVDRMVAIMFPLVRRTTRSAKLIILSIFLVASIIFACFQVTFPTVDKFGRKKCHYGKSGGYYARMSKYWFVVDAITYSILPNLVIIPCTIIILRQLKAHAKTRKSLGISIAPMELSTNVSEDSAGKRQLKIEKVYEKRRINLTLIGVCIIYAVCTSIFCLFEILEYTLSSEHEALIRLGLMIGDNLLFINHTVNWIVYCVTNPMFRAEIFDLLKCKCLKKANNPTTINN